MDGPAGVRERDRLVLADGRAAVRGFIGGVEASVPVRDAAAVEGIGASCTLRSPQVGVGLCWVWLVENGESREVLPC